MATEETQGAVCPSKGFTMDSIFLSSQALRAFWDEHPTWVLQLIVRNYNWITEKKGDDDWKRPSVRARLSESLVSDYKEDRYVEDGLWFDVFFGADFTKFFPGGVQPKVCRAQDIATFAEQYSRETGRTVSVTHQYGSGDQEQASFDVLGYWRNGMNASTIYRDATRNTVSRMHPQRERERFVEVYLYLGHKYHFEQFTAIGQLYVHGRPLSQKWVKHFQTIGFDGVRSVLSEADEALAVAFPEFRNMPLDTASIHLI